MKKNKLIYGWGINDSDYSVTKHDVVGGKEKVVWVCPIYEDWKGVIRRSQDLKYLIKHPTYADVTVCEEWRYFSNFRRWVLEEQPNKDWENCAIDKDLLLKGNRHYSPTTCVYVDVKINNFLVDNKVDRGEYHIGVTFEADKYRARCHNPFTKKHDHLGLFLSEIEAHKAWQAKKHEIALRLAEEQDDLRVVDALRQRYAPDKDWKD